jgi:hypothetical protein
MVNSNGRVRSTAQHLVKSQPSREMQRGWQAVFLDKDSGEMRRHLATANTFNTCDSIEGGESKLGRLFLSRLRNGCDKFGSLGNDSKMASRRGLFRYSDLPRQNHHQVAVFPRESYQRLLELRSALISNWAILEGIGNDSRLRIATRKPHLNMNLKPKDTGMSWAKEIITHFITEHNLWTSIWTAGGQSLGDSYGIAAYGYK